MNVLKTFRHEYKYYINYNELVKIKNKLGELMEYDQDSNGYMIRSLYFDSVNDIDYYEKLGGVIERKKIRMRIYENNPKLIKLELKSKYDIHQLKESLIISRDVAEELVQGNYSVLLKYNNPVANKIYLIMQENIYMPKCIIEYNRIAFITSTTTRITLDFDLKKSDDISNFFDGNINYLPLSNKDEAVLEVKFDRFLEPYIGDILKNYINNFQSISKYVLGRNL